MTGRNGSIVGGVLAATLALLGWFAIRSSESPAEPTLSQIDQAMVGARGSTDPRTAPQPAEEHFASPDPGRRSVPAPGFAQRSALYSRAAAADDRELAAMIEETRAIGASNARIPALEILLLKLAERDVAAAVAAALDSERSDVSALIAAIATTDPPAVWRAVAQVGDPLARTEYMSAVAAAWFAQDPAGAFATLAALPSGWQREQLLRQGAYEVGGRNPQQALELLSALPAHEQRELHAVVVQQWAKRDPAAAAEWIEAQDVRQQGALAYQIADAYVAQQPEEALAWALRISRSPGRNLWSHMIGEIAKYDPQDALRRAQAAESPAQRAQALGRAIASIAERDPTLAAAYLDQLPPGDARNNAVEAVAMQIALSRPHGAVDWLRDLPDAGMRMAAGQAIASQLAQADVDAAAQMIDRVPKELRDLWIEQVAFAYAQTDVDRGVDWLKRWTDDDNQQLAFTFVHNVALRDLDAGLDVIDRLTDGVERDQMLMNVMGTVAIRSPETAIEHLDEIENSQMRMQATAVIASAWGQQDAAGARKWASSLPAGAARDAALAPLVAQVSSVEDRIAMLEDIQSPERRMSATFQAALRMSRTDPEGMRTLLRRFPLDPQRQQQLDSMVRSGARGRWSAVGQ